MNNKYIPLIPSANNTAFNYENSIWKIATNKAKRWNGIIVVYV